MGLDVVLFVICCETTVIIELAVDKFDWYYDIHLIVSVLPKPMYFPEFHIPRCTPGVPLGGIRGATDLH